MLVGYCEWCCKWQSRVAGVQVTPVFGFPMRRLALGTSSNEYRRTKRNAKPKIPESKIILERLCCTHDRAIAAKELELACRFLSLPCCRENALKQHFPRVFFDLLHDCTDIHTNCPPPYLPME